MLPADLSFNFLCVIIDILCVLWIRRLVKQNSSLLPISAVLLMQCAAAFIIAVLVTEVFGYRLFATLRFLGMAAFWHLPLVMAISAIQSRKKLMWLPAFCLIAVYVYAYYIEPHRLEVTRHEFTDPLLAQLQRPVVIAQISDIQTDHVSPFEAHVFDVISSLKPDLILYTGDYLHTSDMSLYLEQSVQMNQLIKSMQWNPPLGSYAVLGDSDIPTEWTRVFKDTSVVLLSNQTQVIQLPGVTINLVALSPRASRARNLRILSKSIELPPKGRLNIYMGHSPDYVGAVAERGGSFLSLAGHTHGGQVQLPFLGALITLTRLSHKYADWYGPYGAGTLSVSRGIGMERYDAPRVRFLCRPEIRLITLRPPAAEK